MVIIEANANHHNLVQKRPMHELNDARMAEYRRNWVERPKNLEPGDFPLHLDVESTSVCNLRCPFCATTHNKYRDGYMDLGLFRRIVDEGTENGLYSMKLNFRGEPMLHQKLAEMAAYAKEKGLIDVYFNTNATLFTEENVNALIDAGLDRLSISFEGFTPDVYERNRVGAKFEKVVENIRLLKRVRDARGDRPRIRVQTVMLPEFRDSIDRYVAFFEPMADEVSYLDMKDEIERPAHDAHEWACPQLWQRMTVMWDGTLLPCCHDIFARESFGNVADVSIKDAWLGEKETRLRDLHTTARAHEIPACEDCPLRSSEIAKLKG